MYQTNKKEANFTFMWLLFGRISKIISSTASSDYLVYCFADFVHYNILCRASKFTSLFVQFEGSEGEHFQQAAATFCARQKIALSALRDKRRKDPNLHSFLTDAEGNKACRRLQLKDIIPCVMQR